MHCVRSPAAMLLAALLFGVAGQQLFFARSAGVNVLLATTLLLAMGWWLRPRERRPDLTDSWLPVAALVFAALCVIRADPALLAFNIAATAALAAAWFAALGGARITRLDMRAILAEAADLIAGAIDRPIRLVLRSAGPITQQVRSRTGRLARYVGGVALAIPFLIVFSVLFASADPV